MLHGSQGFKIREKILFKIPLQEYTVISQNTHNIKLTFRGKDQKLQVSFNVDEDYLKLSLKCSNSDLNRCWINIAANSEEAIYGCGEQFSELNLRGKEVPLWVEEQGVGRGEPPITSDWYTTYHPQPTFVSSENYFCHCESSSYAKFNFTNPDFHELYIWSIPKEILLGKFKTAVEVISNLSRYLGRQPKLPDWVYE